MYERARKRILCGISRALGQRVLNLTRIALRSAAYDAERGPDVH